MIYGAILAGGVGARMGGDKPKQYLTLKDKPIIVYTIEKFFIEKDFDEVLVLCPSMWVEKTKDIIEKYIPAAADKVVVLEGGEKRNDTIMNAIKYIEEQGNLDDDTVLVTHDSVRPFVSHRIIKDNIEALKEYDACDTVISATDTIVVSDDGSFISEIPDRGKMYQGQTPQSFKAKKFKELYLSLSDEEKDILTDGAKIFVIKGEKVALVTGDTLNMKITYPYDLRVARSLVEEEDA